MILRCKMCGGNLLPVENATTCQCDSCGTVQTIPRLEDDRRANLYDRANHFRRGNEYDKAMGIFEQILQEDRTDAEAYWSLVLCRYGIEYVEDPATHKRVPTVNRAQFTSVLADEDYKSALQYADAVQRGIYEQEAKAIDDIQKGILDISKKEKPFDVFICYKETDAAGRRTPDSVLANDLYHSLTKEGFKVFFSRITLEDKLGQQYEPYIFAALNSAKVMVVLGTRPEYFNAVWVKNEWSRYLKLIRADGSKTLVPAYKDMDPYDLPEEFSHLQAQDMSKLGFMQDLIHGIRKLTGQEQSATASRTAPAVQPTAAGADGSNASALLDRAFMALEDGEFDKADDFCEKVLNIDARNARAYLGKMMAEMKIRKESGLSSHAKPLDASNNYVKALRFADEGLKATLTGANDTIKNRNEQNRMQSEYDGCMDALKIEVNVAKLRQIRQRISALTGFKDAPAGIKAFDDKIESIQDAAYRNATELMRQEKYRLAADAFRGLEDYRDSEEKVAECKKLALEKQARDEERVNAGKYQDAVDLMKQEEYGPAVTAFRALGDYRDSRILAAKCDEMARRAKTAAAKKKTIGIVIAAITAVVIAVILVVTTVIIPGGKYSDAVALQLAGQYDEAIAAFEALGDYKDCGKQIKETKYLKAVSLQQAGKYEEAIAAFEALGDYKDCGEQIKETNYLKAKSLLEKKDYAGAYAIFINLKGYKDVDNLLSTDENLKAVAREAKLKPYMTNEGYVTYGTYPQTAAGNDSTPIEWLVLDYDAKDNKALLISRYGLDCQPYNSRETSVTWKTCSLRTWLNGTFLNKAFSKAEQGAILTTEVDNSKSQCYSGYSTNGGNNTKDKIFLLSYAEANKYFDVQNYSVSGSVKNTKFRVAPTAYAVKQGAYTNSNYKTEDGLASGYWWLRSPGLSASSASIVYYNGSLGHNNIVDCGNDVVRPAFWLDLSGI